jgi:predicted MPP superfamily phosphohydrolase
VFAAIITSIYFLMNWYVLGRLAYLFGIRRNVFFYVIVAAMAFSLLAAIMLDTRIGSRLTGAILTAATTWLGICFLFVWCLLALQIIGWFVKIPPAAVGITAIVIVAGLTLYSAVNARLLYIRSIEVAAPTNLKIAQISDIHIGSTGGDFFSHVIDKVNELKPDVVLITGDLVDNDKAATAAAVENLNRLLVPVFFVTGNHERYVGYDNVRRLLAPTKVKWLRNEGVTFGKVRIVGVDDNTNAKVMDEILERAVNGAAYTILMYHRPEWLETVAGRNVNLMLTGHTHHGQLWPFNFVVGLFYEYITGLHQISQMHLYVSNGTGTWGPRMRLGSHSEIAIIRLTAEAQK